jgi:hypothetical protein
MPARPDPIGRQLSRTCAEVLAQLEGVPDPDDLAGVATNAGKERAMLKDLRDELERFPIDPRRRKALQQYIVVVGNERRVDRLVMRAAGEDDRPAVNDLVAQNDHNRAKRRQLAGRLSARDCRPGRKVTD